MSDWTAGYVADIGYTFGYYNELSPHRARLAMLYAGLAVPAEGAIHCELGFGQGLSANVNSAATGGTWHGNDFNPTQAAYAQAMARASGAAAHLTDESLTDFCARPDLPQFDSIGLHGIWSWISDQNRATIVDFVRRKLKVGGVLYVSYNTLPGWASFAPMRHLLTEHVRALGTESGGSLANVDGALAFAHRLLETAPSYARANSQVTERFAKVRVQDKNYLAHEYFNRDWEPMHFSTMAQWLAPAKLSFACSGHLLDHVDAINFSKAQKALLDSVSDGTLKETVRDFVVNQQFRRDYWVKGPRRLARQEQTEQIRALRVLLVIPAPEVSLKAMGPQGEVTLNEEVYRPILQALADHVPRQVSELEAQLVPSPIKTESLFQGIFLLMGIGGIALVQSESQISAARDASARLNGYIIGQSAINAELQYLASPVIGAGVSVGRFQQLFLLARGRGLALPSDWADFAWQILKSQNQRLLIDGKALESEQENLAELGRQAEDFLLRRLPVLVALGIA